MTDVKTCTLKTLTPEQQVKLDRQREPSPRSCRSCGARRVASRSHAGEHAERSAPALPFTKAVGP